MSVSALPGEAVVRGLGLTLVHFLWQGALLAAALAAANRALRGRSPNARYLAAAASLALMLALPIATFVRIAADPPRSPAATDSDAAAGGTLSLSSSLGTASAIVPADVRTQLAESLPLVVRLWLAGVALLALRSVGGWRMAQRLKRSGREARRDGLDELVLRMWRTLKLSRPVQVWESALVEVPTAIGWLKPVVLLPASTLAGMSATQLEMILAHELAHVRRLDYLVNLLQTAVETLLFYHPAVWWASRRMRVERELCCDDLAVQAGGDAVGYARALADLERLRFVMPSPALAASGGTLLDRIARLLGATPPRPTASAHWLAALLALAIVGLGAGAGLTQTAQEPPAPASEETDPPDAERPAEAPVPPAPAAPARPARAPRPAAASRPATQAAPAPDAARKELSVEKVLELARAGITPEWVDEMTQLGYESLSWDRLVELRGQGVGPSYVRGMQKAGLGKLGASELIQLRSQGVSPEYVAELKTIGYTDLSVGDLVTLRSQGVSAQYASELKQLGLADLSLTRLVALRNQGVSADYVRELKALGYADLSVPRLLALRSQGVTPDYVKGLKDLGYDGLSTGVLIELRSQGVTPDYVKELRDAGYARLAPEELIQLRSQGVRGDLLRKLRGR